MSNRQRSNQMIFIFKCTLSIAYVIMGAVIFYIRNSEALSIYSMEIKVTFALLCIVYGIFRLYRAISEYKISQE